MRVGKGLSLTILRNTVLRFWHTAHIKPLPNIFAVLPPSHSNHPIQREFASRRPAQMCSRWVEGLKSQFGRTKGEPERGSNLDSLSAFIRMLPESLSFLTVLLGSVFLFGRLQFLQFQCCACSPPLQSLPMTGERARNRKLTVPPALPCLL